MVLLRPHYSLIYFQYIPSHCALEAICSLCAMLSRILFIYHKMLRFHIREDENELINLNCDKEDARTLDLDNQFIGN
jgi:hypothetical protein